MKTFITVSMLSLLLVTSCEIMPRNTLKDCRQQCKESKKAKACYEFCDCIHKQGQPLDSCLDKYNKAPEDSLQEIPAP
jgi:hypothetical protein